MPRIPRLEQTQQVQIAAQPTMSPDSLAGPGRALQQLGSSIGSAFAGQQDETAQFEAQLAVQKWNNEVDLNELQFRSSYSGDGKDYYPQRAEYFDSTIPDLQAKISNAPLAFQRKAALLIEQKRGSYGEGAYRYGDEVRSKNLFAETEAAITGDFAKVSGATPEEIQGKLTSALSGVNAVISSYPGNDGHRERLREHAARLLTEKILNDKSIPDYMKPQALDALMGEWSKTQAAPPPGPQSSLPSGVGSVSAKYESGGRGVGFVSTGYKDPGGPSYGIHQLSSKDSMPAFLRSQEGRQYADQFKGKSAGSAEFNEVYKKIAAADPEGFASAQHAYYSRTHFRPVLDHARNLGFDVDDRGVQEALFSISVQHGGAKKIVSGAKSAVGKDAAAQITALFDRRARYVEGVDLPAETKSSVLNRYRNEVKDVLQFAGQKAGLGGPTQVAALDPRAGVGNSVGPVTGQQPPGKITEVLKGTPEEKAAKLRELVSRGYQDIVHQVDGDGNDVIVAKQGDKPAWQRGRRGTDAEGRIPNELDNDQFAGPSWANGVVSDMKAGKIERVQTADQAGRIPSMRPSVEAKAAEIIIKQRDTVQARAVASTKAMVERAEKVATEGKMLPDEERAVVEQAIAAVKSPELALKYQIAMATAQETSRLRTLRPDQIQARAIELKAAIAAAGQKATPEMLARASAVEKLAKHVSTQLDKDMLAWGQEIGIIPALEKIDPANPDPAVLQQRAQAAQVLGERYGRPPQFFTSEEREIMTKVMAEGGEAMVQRLGVMAEAFGDGMPAAMAEIAKDAPEAATLGWLIAKNGDTQTINDLSDAVAMKARKDKAYDVYAVQDKDALFNGRTEIATAFMGSPQTQKRVLDLSSALYQVRAFRAGKDPKAGVDAKMYQQAVRDVLGETTDPKSGAKFGGIYKQGSWFSGPYSQNIVIPPNVRQDKFHELVASIRSQDLIKGGVPALPSGMEAPKDADVAEGAAASKILARGSLQTPTPNVTLGTPLDSKGRPISAGALQNMTLVSVGEGKYQIAQGDPASNEPKFVAEMGPDGRLKEYVLDLKQLEPVLKQRRPDLYKPE